MSVVLTVSHVFCSLCLQDILHSCNNSTEVKSKEQLPPHLLTVVHISDFSSMIQTGLRCSLTTNWSFIVRVEKVDVVFLCHRNVNGFIQTEEYKQHNPFLPTLLLTL